MKTTEENGLVFWRHHCKEGFIDRWMGDAVIDPNHPEIKTNYSLNSIRVMYRLNGEGEWKSKGNWASSFFAAILNLSETKTATEIWNEFRIE